MAELTSTKIYGDLQVVRDANINGMPLQNSTDRPGLLEIGNLESYSWTGTQFKFSDTALWSMFGNQTQFGMYDDTNSDWILRYTENLGVELMYNAVTKLETTTGGIDVTGRATVDGLTTSSHIYGSNSIDIGNTGSLSFRHISATGTVYADDNLSLNWDSVAQVLDANDQGIYTTSDFCIGGTILSTDPKLEVDGTIRSSAAAAPTAGTGLEMYWNGSAAYLHPYNRTTPGYPGTLNLRGTTVYIDSASGGTLRSGIDVGYTNIVVNEQGEDVDFRVESDGYLGAIMLRASDSKIGLAKNATSSLYKDVEIKSISTNANVLNLVGRGQTDGGLLIQNGVTTTYAYCNIDFAHGTSASYYDEYSAGRIAFVGAQGTSETTAYNYFTWILFENSADDHLQFMRLCRTGDLHVRGDVVAYSTTITSDERLKENIKTVEADSLSKIMSLRPVTFNWKAKSKSEQLSTGFIAQEFEEHFPEMISETIVLAANEDPENETEYKHIRYTELVPHLTKSIQQQQDIIDNQQKEIDDLKEKVELLLEKL